jgi:hypothetical protein
MYAILNFDLLIVYPLAKLFKEKPSHGSLDEKLGVATSIIPIPSPKNPKAKQQPNHNTFEEVKFISPFVSPKLACETERVPSPLLEPKLCPSGHPNVVLNSDQDSTLTLHERFHAMDMPKAPTLETKGSTIEHESSSVETPHVSYSLLKSLEFIVLSTICNYEDPNHLSILVSKLFKRMVVEHSFITNIANPVEARGTNLAA